ncbi:MAG: DoxX family membrane protein [Acidobacteriota bacterium]|nr:DoxX family membrane protein [Acidobacteriota bacterium]
MKIEETLDKIHESAILNVWLQRFTIFTRVMIAVGFVPSGMKKVLGLPFTQLGVETPMGYFFDALYKTGGWYEFIGWAQVVAAILLLIPRTATLGALIFFPIIINIAVLTNSMDFAGTKVITIFMALAATYLLCWDYDKLKPIFKRRERKCSSVQRNDFVFEGLFWAILGLAGYAVFAFIGIGNIYRLGFAGAIAAFTGGLLFGLYSVWHRRAAFAVT